MNIDHDSKSDYPCFSNEGKTRNKGEGPMIVSFSTTGGPETSAEICRRVLAVINDAAERSAGSGVRARATDHPRTLRGDLDRKCSIALEADSSYNLKDIVELIKNIDGVSDISASLQGLKSVVSRATLTGSDRR